MLNYQANFAEILEEIYKPVNGGTASEVGTIRRVQTPVQSMKTVSEFVAVMVEIRDTILPELELIDRRVVQPTSDFITIIKLISKTITKRDHKRIDYDRHRVSVKKIRDKREKSLSDEKNLYKLEEQLDTATKDYDYYNDLLKKELPQFFEYRTQFIEPIFEEFYHMQLKIYGLMLERMDRLVATGYFDVNSNVIDGFDERRVDIQGKLEALTLLGRRAKLEERRNSNNSADTQIEQSRSANSNSRPTSSSKPTRISTDAVDELEEYNHEDDMPPPYTASPTNLTNSSTSRADGDLTFRKDDRIQLIERTEDKNDWWTGKLNGVVGVFPGNYVEEL
ncbi:11499_t:CDS:2, partial [Ambispora leptoticha]